MGAEVLSLPSYVRPPRRAAMEKVAAHLSERGISVSVRISEPPQTAQFEDGLAERVIVTLPRLPRGDRRASWERFSAMVDAELGLHESPPGAFVPRKPRI